MLNAEGDYDGDGNQFDLFDADIHKATNGLEAVQKIEKTFQHQQFCYGLIFMDCSMPVMDGFEASETIKSFCADNRMPKPLIVAVTGHAE